jgi:hypothetical protein
MRGAGISAIAKIGQRYRGPVIFARLAILAAFAVGFAAAPGHAQVQITDVAEVGNELAGPIDSVAGILNGRACLTLEERVGLFKYLERLREQAGQDFDLLEKAGFVRESHREILRLAGSSKPLSPGARARLRLINLRNQITRLEKEVTDHPICPPGSAYPQIGLYIGGHFVKLSGFLKSKETLDATGQVTNQFSDRKDPFGAGFIVGARFTPWANNVVVSPFASFDFVHAAVNHTFAGGSFLGTTANFIGTAGVKVGPQLSPSAWVYGIAGVSALNQTLNVNFLPVASSKDATVPGATVGVGAAFRPDSLRGLGRPVSVFVEYQHSWWQNANFNTPAASPLFNYAFRRQDDVVKLGFTVPLGAPPLPPLSNLPVKAPVSK